MVNSNKSTDVLNKNGYNYNNTNGKSQLINITDSSQVTLDSNNNTITIVPLVALPKNSHYNISIASTAIKDLAGNAFVQPQNTPAFIFNTIDTIAPTLNFSSPQKRL